MIRNGWPVRSDDYPNTATPAPLNPPNTGSSGRKVSDARQVRTVQPLRLTRRERDALILIEKSIETRGQAPSIREFRDALGASVSGVLSVIDHLERKGRIVKRPGRARGLTILHRWEPGEEPAGSMKDVAISLRRMAERIERVRA
jgi:hypothetical protein